jgi:site-specific recombinase XerD
LPEGLETHGKRTHARLKDYAPILWAGLTTHYTEAEMDALAFRLIQGYPARNARRLLDWFRQRVASYNQEHDVILPLPSQIVPVMRDGAPVVPRDLSRLAAFRSLEARFYAGCGTYPWDQLPELAGAMLFLWISHGGDASDATLDALIKSLAEPTQVANGRLWLKTARIGSQTMSMARPLSPAIVEIVYRKAAALCNNEGIGLPTTKGAWTAFLRQVGDADAQLYWQSADKRQSIARTLALIRGSGFLHWTLREPRTTAALPWQVVRRLIGGPPTGKIRIVGGEPAPFVAQDPAVAKNVAQIPIESMEGLAELLAALRAATTRGDSSRTAAADIQARRAALVGAVSDATAALYDFAMMQLTRKDAPALPITVRKHLAVVAPAFGTLANGFFVADLSHCEFQSIYELAIADAASAAAVGERLKSVGYFHTFLHQRDGVPDFDLTELDGYVAVDDQIRANIISPPEWRRALIMLDQRAGGDPVMKAAARLPFILAYRLGLRPGEIFGLRVCDIVGRVQVDLQVRPWEHHRLKTPNARRSLPASLLLQDDELDELLAFVARARTHGGPSVRLFSNEWGQPLPHREAFVARYTRALSEATGLEQAPIYLLRHSFANLLLLRLLSPALPRLHELLELPWLSNDECRPDRCRAVLDGFFPDLRGAARPASARIIPAIAALMGHLSPSTTVLHYLHLSELLRGAFSVMHERPYPSAIMERLLNVSAGRIRGLHGPS